MIAVDRFCAPASERPAFDSDALHLESCPKQQRADADECPCGKLPAEVTAVDLIELGEMLNVRTKDLYGYEIIHRHAGRPQRLLQVVEYEASLFGGRFRNLVVCRQPDGARRLQRIADQYGAAVRARSRIRRNAGIDEFPRLLCRKVSNAQGGKQQGNGQ